MLAELLKGGRYESSGTFSLDLARAAEKLGRYQSAEPLFFLLKFVQAAVAGGATCLRIERLRAGVRILADEVRPFPLAEVTSFELDERPQSYVGLGVGAAVAAGASRVVCEVGAQQLVADRAGSRVGTCGRTSFCVTVEGLGVRLERARLQQRLAYAPLPVWFDGQLLNFLSAPVATRRLTTLADRRHGVACAGPWERKSQRFQEELPAPASHGFNLRSCTGVFRREDVYVPICEAVLELRDPKQASRVVLVKHGVALDSTASLRVPGAHCVVSAEGLSLDLSTLRVVEDARFDKLLARLNAEVVGFYREMVAVFGMELHQKKGPSFRQGLWVALGIIGMVLFVVMLVACAGEGAGSVAGDGCSGTAGCGDGCGGMGGSAAPRDKLREALLEVLQNCR